VLGPLAAGELIGAAGPLAKAGVRMAGDQLFLGEGTFSIAYKAGNQVIKVVKSTVPVGAGTPTTLTAAERATLAQRTVELTNKVSDGIGGGIVPKMDLIGYGMMRQPLAQGRTLAELKAQYGEKSWAVLNAEESMDALTARASKVLGYDRATPLTPEGWEVHVDLVNTGNFRFDDNGNIVSWFDPVLIQKPAPPPQW
jgi:hypothetical protein